MRQVTRNDYHERILKVLLHVHDHLSEELDIESLADLAGFSPFHFHRIFRGVTGEPLYGMVKRLRLERAASTLRKSASPVTFVALEAGYETLESFSRSFKSEFGMAPSLYRRDASPVTGSPHPSTLVVDGTLRLFDRSLEVVEMEVKVVDLPNRRVAFARHIGPYEKVGETWGIVYGWAMSHGYFPPKTQFLGRPLDDPDVTDPDRIRYDACFEVGDSFKPEGQLDVQVIDGGEYAMAVHRGSYNRIGETYAELCGRWVPVHGREIRSLPSFEIYMNNPTTTREEDLLTEVYVPLEKEL